MDAYISGMRGLAVLVDGKSYFGLEPQQEKPRPISRSAAMILLDGCGDLEKLPVRVSEEASQRLHKAIAEQRTLQAALLVLDGRLSAGLRQTIAASLEELLVDDHLAAFLESTLYAKPLPTDADLPGALEAAKAAKTERAASFFEQLGILQPLITRVAAAWDEIPADLLGIQAAEWTPILVRQGLFRRLVLQKHHGKDLQIVLAESIPSPHFRRLSGSAAILKAWIGRLGHTATPRPSPESYVAEPKDRYDSEAWDRSTAAAIQAADQLVVRRRDFPQIQIESTSSPLTTSPEDKATPEDEPPKPLK